MDKWFLSPKKARGPDVLWKAIHECNLDNSRLITTLETEFKTYFKALRFHHALWGWSHFPGLSDMLLLIVTVQAVKSAWKL